MISSTLTEHLYLREHTALKTNLTETLKEKILNLPRLSKLVSRPVLAGLAGDPLVDVLHIRVYLHLVGSKSAEQELVALLRLQGGGPGQDRGSITLGI